MSIYFVQIGRDGPIKIGHSDNVSRRMTELQCRMPWQLYLLGTVQSCFERDIYHHFSASRMRGEWFYPTKNLLDFIRNPFKLPRASPALRKAARDKRGTNLSILRPVFAYTLPPELAVFDAGRAA